MTATGSSVVAIFGASFGVVEPEIDRARSRGISSCAVIGSGDHAT